ncbi:MAG TPA: O-antigen ligase family protein [Chitinophaga sp.]|uniref:O-antigen ligase family protein n=1 Tax=Chitinophaga sp. TaxID=1869181 RepID=UPI002CF7C271|nr:O-antigen ligase family protein [Chitinophaga sp.]HVI45458.1 O-antigen ligase family protein [Chitinophaga sp.]
MSWPNLLVFVLLGLSIFENLVWGTNTKIAITGLVLYVWFIYSVFVLIFNGKAQVHLGEIFALYRVIAIFYSLRTLFLFDGENIYIRSAVWLAVQFTILAYLQEFFFLTYGDAALGLDYSSIKVTEDIMASLFGFSFVRAHFLVGDPNYFALYILPGVGVMTYKIINKFTTGRLILFIFIFTGILLTFSRGALLSFFVCFAIFFYRSNISIYKKVVTFLVFILLGIGVVANMNRGENTSSSSEERSALIQDAFKKTVMNPLGYGIGELVLESKDNDIKMTAHNTFVEILLFSGILGLAIFLLIIGKSLLYASGNGLILAVFITVLIAGTFLSCTIYMVYWLYLLAPIAYNRKNITKAVT